MWPLGLVDIIILLTMQLWLYNQLQEVLAFRWLRQLSQGEPVALADLQGGCRGHGREGRGVASEVRMWWNQSWPRRWCRKQVRSLFCFSQNTPSALCNVQVRLLYPMLRAQFFDELFLVGILMKVLFLLRNFKTFKINWCQLIDRISSH